MVASPPTSRLLDWFQSGSPPVRVLDGGVSTHLEALQGSTTFLHRELWSSSLLLSNPDLVQRGHEDWLRAGADIISTVTYQCHFESSLLPKGFNKAQVESMLRDALDRARAAQSRSRRPSYIAYSSGCYGGALSNGAEYTGDYGSDAPIERFHREKLEFVLPLQPDAVALETVPNIEEVRVLATLVDELLSASSNVAVWLSLACRNDRQLNDGTPIDDVWPVLRSRRHLSAIGFNCGRLEDLEGLVTSLLRDMVQHGPMRGLVLYPNSGEVWDAANLQWMEGTGTVDMASALHRLVTRRIPTIWRELCTEFKTQQPSPSILVGGCCRTTPATIQALRQKLDQEAKHASLL